MSDITDLKAEVLLLRQENKELRADQAHWELGNCPNCPNVVNLQEALEQNSKLCAEVEAEKQRNAKLFEAAEKWMAKAAHFEAENTKLRPLVSDMGKMLTLASWASVENDEQASQCIYRAEALGIEVE